MRNLRMFLASLLVLGGISGISACAAAPEAPAVEVSEACNSAFDVASAAMNEHYATHPFYSDEYDAMYLDGVTPEEQTSMDAIFADEQAQFAALVDPVYDACNGYEELYAAAFAHRDDADWALLDVPSMTREEIKQRFVVSHCYGNEARSACADFVAEDWHW